MDARARCEEWARRLREEAARMSAVGPQVAAWGHSLGEFAGYDGFTLGLEADREGDRLILEIELRGLPSEVEVKTAHLRWRQEPDHRSLYAPSLRCLHRNLPAMVRSFERWLRRGPRPRSREREGVAVMATSWGDPVPVRPASFRPLLGSDPEFGIFRAALEHLFPPEDFPTLVLSRHTGLEHAVDYDSPGMREAHEQQYGEQAVRCPGLLPETWRALARNGDELLLDPGLTLDSRELAFTAPDHDPRKLYGRHARAQGVLQLWRPALHPDGRQAFLALHNTTFLDPFRSRDFQATLLLEPCGGGWRVVQSTIRPTSELYEQAREMPQMRLRESLAQEAIALREEGSESLLLEVPGKGVVRVLTRTGLRKAVEEGRGVYVPDATLAVVAFLWPQPVLAALEALPRRIPCCACAGGSGVSSARRGVAIRRCAGNAGRSRSGRPPRTRGTRSAWSPRLPPGR